MKRQLPPLKALAALESVVRTGSLSAAAEELCVTHSAVSKQIGSLEAWIGQPLFAGNRRQMLPTQETERLVEAADKAFGLIADAIDEMQDQRTATILQVIAPSTFAMRWLLPRLPEFQASDPSIKVRVRQTHTPEHWLGISFDVAIRRGGRIPRELSVTHFLDEQLGLVVSPKLLDQKDREPASGAAELPFIEAETRAGELAGWLEAAGQPPQAGGALRFPHFYIALEAALAGRGALVAPIVVLQELLAKGELVEPWPASRVAGPGYKVAYAASGPQAENAEALVRWLVRSAAECLRAAPTERVLLTPEERS